MKAVAVFCGSSRTVADLYFNAARRLGSELAQRNLKIVYGGGAWGLMGAVADAAMEADGQVVGVIPENLIQRELAHTGLTALHVVETMHERKKMMYDLADAFLILPGGVGTLDELFETLAWRTLDIHSKPVGILNVAGFYDDLQRHIERLYAEGFLGESLREHIVFDEDPESLIAALEKMM